MSQLRELPRYKCHKEVGAAKITQIIRDFPGGSNGPATLVFDAAEKAIKVDANFMEKHKPSEGWYFVIYEDGYSSASPAEAFESGYTKME